MRSWMSPRTRCKSESSEGPEKNHATPRSMRRTASRPQRRAISLAFDDHGEMVPRRGTLSSMRPPPAGAGSPYCSRRSSAPLSRDSSGRSASTKCQYSAAAIRTDPWDVARRELSLSSRKAETARLPRSLRINDMKRAGKVRLYRTLAPANSVAAAELGILQSACKRERRARLHAQGAKLDLHPPGQVFLWIHFDLSRAVQEARRQSNLANEEPIGIRGYGAAHLGKERRPPAGAAALQQPRHVDVGDRAFLYREIALELGVQDQPFGEKPLHGVHALALQRPSGEERRGDLPCLHLAHRQLALHAPAARPSEAHGAEQPPAESARLGFAQRELAPRHRALRQKLAETRIHADGKGEGVRGDFDRRSLPLRLQLHRKLSLCVGNRNRLQRAVRRKTRIDFQRRQVQLGDIDLQSLGYYALDPERHAPALVLQQRGEKFPGEGRAFQLETLERYSVPQQGGDHRGGLDHGCAHRVLFSNHHLLELQLRERQQRQVDGADLDWLPEPRLRHLFILSGFQGHEGKRGNRHDEGQEQHHRKLLREAAGPSFRPEFPRGKRGFVGRLFLFRPALLRPRRLAGLLGSLRLRLFLCADPFLLFLGALLLFLCVLFLLLGAPRFLGALRFLLGFATGALLLLPALLLLALPVLSFASRVLLLLPQRTLEGFTFLLLLAQLFLATGSLFFLAARALLGFTPGAHLGFDLDARFGFDAGPELGLFVLLAPAAFDFLTAHALLDFFPGALLRLAPHTLLGVTAHFLFRFETCARLGLAPGPLLVLAPGPFLDLPADALLGLAPRLVECFRLRSRLGVGLGVGTRRKPGPRRKPCFMFGLGFCPRRRLGPRPRRGFFARARSLGLASDFLRLDLKSCVLARLRGRLRGSKRSEVEVLAGIRSGRCGRRAWHRGPRRLVLLPDELAQVAFSFHALQGFDELGLGHLRECPHQLGDADLAVDFLEDVAEIPRQIAGLAGRLHQALAGLCENRSTIHTRVGFIALA